MLARNEHMTRGERINAIGKLFDEIRIQLDAIAHRTDYSDIMFHVEVVKSSLDAANGLLDELDGDE